jgi:probable HAF family extracellular repeat protein
VDIGSVSQQAKISRDGKVIVGDAKDNQGITTAAIWQGGTNWKTLGGVPNGRVQDKTLSSAWDVSGDGSVIVGLAWVQPTGSHGFRWDARNGMVDLGSLQKQSSRASIVSADGNVVAGWDANPDQSGAYYYWRGSIWWQGLQRLMNPFGWIGQAEGINDCGSVIVGRGQPSASDHAYRYTAWDGRIEDLGSIPRGFLPNTQDKEDQSIAFGVSDDGGVVVGSSGWQPPTDAFIWTEATKMVKVSEFLMKKGVIGLEGWTLVVANSVSPDGKIIAGTGVNPRGLVEGWVANLQ